MTSGKGSVGELVSDRLTWANMRMDPTDIEDVTGYTFLVNGCPPGGNFTALFRPGERLRLRVINSLAMTYQDVRIPGLRMTVVQAGGQNVQPVLRRTGTPGRAPRGSQIRFAGWTLDTGWRMLNSPGGAAVDLSGAEYDLLTMFLDHPHRVLSRERLLELARNRVSVNVADRSVDVQVSRLLQTLEGEGDGGSLIKTVRGVGDMFAVDVEE